MTASGPARRSRFLNGRRRLVLAMSLAALGCASVSSSAIVTGVRYLPNTGPVGFSALQVPAGASEVGIVQAVGTATIVELVPEFIQRAAVIGGNFALLESVRTRFETVARPYSYSYRCGYRSRNTCWRQGFRSHEIAYTELVGRAFRVSGAPP